jgi:drug/metabolite transporter (DMT)-like permease
MLSRPVLEPRRRLTSAAGAGLAFTLASAIFLSGLGVTTQLAFDAGATVGTLLPGRFVVAAAILWPVVWAFRSRRPTRRQVLAGLLLGVAFSAHAALFTASLAKLDAGLVDLLLFTYPGLVMLGAVMLRRERWSGRRAGALGTATAGTTLVLVGGLHGIDPLGVVLALASAVAYAAYILASADQLERSDPFLLTALVATGGAITLTAGSAARNGVALDIGASALALIGVVGVVAVAGGITFIAGIGRLGASRASIVSAVQPALTPVVGYFAFADRLGPEQMLGGALVVAGVVILETKGRLHGVLSKLSWLPRRERWALGRVTGPMDVPAGRRLLRQGESAGAFFLVERGRASVTRDDRQIAELGPGDFFGEVALLRGGERTASVYAGTDMRLRVISQPEFAPAMRRLPTLARFVREVAFERVQTPQVRTAS